jgi:hypothetical protein
VGSSEATAESEGSHKSLVEAILICGSVQYFTQQICFMGIPCLK